MSTIVKKTGLSDSFESQKKAARAVVNGLLANEIVPQKKEVTSSSEIRKAQMRGRLFVQKYGS